MNAIKVRADRRMLKTVFEKLGRVIETRTTSEIMKAVLIEAENPDSVVFTTVGRKMRIKIKVECEVEESGVAAPDFRFISKIIEKSVSDELEFITDGGTEIIIKAGRSKFTLNGYNAYDFPEYKRIAAKSEITLNEGRFINMVKSVLYAKSEDETREIFTGMKLDINDGVLYTVTLDRFRMGICKTTEFNGDEEDFGIVADGGSLVAASKVFKDEEGDISVSTDGNSLRLANQSIEFISSLLEGGFVSYRQIIPSFMPIRVRLNREELLRCTERSLLFNLTILNSPMRMEFIENGIHISTKSGTGHFDDFIDCERVSGSDEKQTIGFNGKYMVETLKAIDDEEIIMEVKDGDTCCLVRPVTGDDYLHMVLPVILH